MSSEIKALAIEYQAAQAAGDRPRLIAIMRRLRELLGNLDEGQLYNGIAFLKKILDLLFPPADPSKVSALAYETLSAEEAEAAGLALNPTLWIQLITLLIEAIRRIRGE